jgi:hypothetical protein
MTAMNCNRAFHAGVLTSMVVVCAALLSTAPQGVQAAGSPWLLTERQAAREQAWRRDNGVAEDARPPTDSTRSLAPVIRLIAPAEDVAEIQPPLNFEIAFDTSADAHVLPDTLRVSYGFLKVDLTAQWRKLASISSRGLVIRNVSVPGGTHWFVIRITDDRGRTAERGIRVRVRG